MLFGESSTFSFHSVGETTGETFTGDFTVKPILSFGARALADADKRRFLGNPENTASISEDLLSIAIMISQIKYRIIKAPTWFNETSALEDMVDSNILTELFAKVIDVEKQYRANIVKKGEQAKQELIKNEAK